MYTAIILHLTIKKVSPYTLPQNVAFTVLFCFKDIRRRILRLMNCKL